MASCCTKELTRTVPYWSTVIAATWIVIVCYAWNTDKGYDGMQENFVTPVSNDSISTFIVFLHSPLSTSKPTSPTDLLRRQVGDGD